MPQHKAVPHSVYYVSTYNVFVYCGQTVPRCGKAVRATWGAAAGRGRGAGGRLFLKGKAKGITPETALGSASHITAQTEEV